MPAGFPIDKFHFRRNSVLEGLPKEELEYLESKMILHKYKRGQNIFVEGTVPNGIYYLNSGKIKKYKADQEGKEQIIYVCSEGELFGYPALLCGEPYTDSAAALEESVVSFLPQKDFLTLLDRSTELPKKLLINLSHEFGVLINSIAAFAHKSVRERLALSLLILKDKYKIKGQEDKPVEIILPREDLANIIGVALETLVRLLHTFKDEGLIETEGRKIRILDPMKLVKVANFY
jgi:CRP-like cAMP-binding protein